MMANTPLLTIAALYVDARGPYANMPGVDVWDEARDARRYAGPHPVIAHPPCQRWGRFWAGSPLVIARTGVRQAKGDDGGCFAAALADVRAYGGILEHPWGSAAWPNFGLAIPPRLGGWVRADDHGGMTCCVEQGQYGHYARKPTLLYAVGAATPALKWGHSPPALDPEMIARYGVTRAKRLGELGGKGGGKNSPIRIHTPPEFRDLLIDMVRNP